MIRREASRKLGADARRAGQGRGPWFSQFRGMRPERDAVAGAKGPPQLSDGGDLRRAALSRVGGRRRFLPSSSPSAGRVERTVRFASPGQSPGRVTTGR